jgi:hypothetical protein
MIGEWRKEFAKKRRNESGRCVSAANQYPHRPGIAPALGLRAGSDGPVILSQTVT